MMENTLSLKEKFMLLCLHSEKGKIYWDAQYYTYGVTGAILLELAGLKKIKIADKRLIINDGKKTGDTVLDFVLDLLGQSQNEKKVQTWIQKFSSFRMARMLKGMILDGLVEKRMLGKEEATFLFFFKYYRYPARETKIRAALLKNIGDYVIRNRETEPDIKLLASLVGSAQITSRVFEKADRKFARKKLKELNKGNEVSQIVGETVAAVQAAIAASVATTVAVSAASR